jgi:hypothetical protein
MPREIVGPGHSSSNAESPSKRRLLLATTILNLALIAALTFAMSFATAILPSPLVLIFYLIPVVLATLLWNFEQGLIAAFASALAVLFFDVEPVFSFHVAHWRDVIALSIFLAAALLCGYLVDEVRRIRRDAGAAPALLETTVRSAPKEPVLRFGGPTRTVPERIAEFLVGREGNTFCDQCIQDELGLKWRQQVQLVTATLAVTRLFRRDSGECQSCHQFKQVIRHVAPH